MSSSPDRPHAPIKLVVLISGRGSNLQAIVDSILHEKLPAVLCAVISNRPRAPGLAHAERAGAAAVVVNQAGYRDRRAFERDLLQQVGEYQPDLVVLAGFMHVLDSDFVQAFEGRLMNIHPSLLPEFRGLHTHERAIAAGVREHGASVHFVTDELDGGPVIVREAVPVLPDDDAERLADRVLQVEHRIYPLAIRWFAEGRLRQQGSAVLFDGKPLSAPLDGSAAADHGPGLADHRGTPAG